MPERENPFKVVGGKDHIPDATEKKSEAEVSDLDLIRLNKEIRANLPADYRSKIRKELVEQAAAEMMGWTVAQLYTTLSQPNIWERPSSTVAALEEVRLRMLAGSMEPRKHR